MTVRTLVLLLSVACSDSVRHMCVSRELDVHPASRTILWGNACSEFSQQELQAREEESLELK